MNLNFSKTHSTLSHVNFPKLSSDMPPSFFLNSWARELYELTTDEEQVLLSIAAQTPYKGGKAVYTARLMVGYELEEGSATYMVDGNNDSNGNTTANIAIYPNPASEFVAVEFENQGSKEVSGQLNIYNLSGQLMMSTGFVSHDSFHIVDISSLKSGVYLFNASITTSGDATFESKSGKLVVIER